MKGRGKSILIKFLHLFFRLRQKRLIVDVAEFLLSEQIPQFVRECREGVDTCLDTVSLVDNIHHKGIGVRYLGLIQKLLLAENDANLEHVINVVNTEMISRAIKWIFRYHLQKADQGVTAIAVSHLLNCLFATCHVPHPATEDINSNHGDGGSGKKKKGKKGKNKQTKPAAAEVNPAAVGWQRLTNEWRDVTPDSIWKEVEKRARSYFKTDIDAKSIESVCQTYQIQKVTKLATENANFSGKFVARRLPQERYPAAPEGLRFGNEEQGALQRIGE